MQLSVTSLLFVLSPAGAVRSVPVLALAPGAAGSAGIRVFGIIVQGRSRVWAELT